MKLLIKFQDLDGMIIGDVTHNTWPEVSETIRMCFETLKAESIQLIKEEKK